MIQQVLRLFRQDFWLKILAVALSILLWAMVVQDYNKVTTATFDVTLSVIQHPTYELFEGRRDLETAVAVSVTGPSLLISSLDESEIKAWADYSRVTEPGKTVNVEVQVEGPERIQDQVKYRVTPQSVPVTLVEYRTLTVPVILSRENGVVRSGDREFYYMAAVEDRVIELRGREDYLKYVRRGLVTLEEADLQPPLNNGVLERTVTIRKPIVPADASDKPVEKLGEPSTNVVLTWEELPPGKTVRVQVPTMGVLPSGFELVGLMVEPETVTARSASLDGRMPDLTAVLAEPIDLTGQTKTFTTSARLVVPQGTSLSATSVNVRVSIAETEMEKVFGAVPISLRNQPADSDIVMPVPAVQVRVKGPYTLMAQFDASAITVYVDLEGLGDGRHRVPVKVPTPPGVSEVAVDPAIVDIVITNR